MDYFNVAAVISNHCVLQRNVPIKIFGTAQNNKNIFVTLFDKEKKILSQNSCISSEKKWELSLTPQSAQENCSLLIKCESQEKTLTDISIGEVWLAGGQSNMEFELQNCTEGPEELLNETNPNVRFYYTNKIGWMDEAFFEAEKNTEWQTWDSEWKKSWSAVGYFYAKKLAADLGVTVGVIGCNWGGTSASAWMSKEYLEKDSDLKSYLDEQAEATKGKSIEQQCLEYDEYVKENDIWQAKSAEIYQKNPLIEWAEVEKLIGKCPWPGPASCKNPYRPTGLYECMLKRIIPYSIKGVIWYQGESDDHKSQMYYKLFSNMILNWREQWKNENLPFIFVQLPEHRYKQDKDYKSWCKIREAQTKVYNNIKNTFMAVGMGLGKFNDIHPTAKKEIAYRLEKAAIHGVYKDSYFSNLDISNGFSPIFKDSLALQDKLILYFDNAKDGFVIKNTDKILNEYKELEAIQGNTIHKDFTGFEIAGKDGIFYPAKYEFGTEEKNSIILYNENVSQPKYARYAWYNYGPSPIYGKNDLPLSPFRTSSEYEKEDSKIEHADIQQIMTV